MCGIFGYIGEEDALKLCIEGLEKLEYRGYDSAGIAGIQQNELFLCKGEGRLKHLKAKLPSLKLHLTIGHTRWATHGKVSELNAHPHTDEKGAFALVHNGIIENCEELRQDLELEGVSFISETDTEVIAQLISKAYKGNLLEAVQKSLPFLKGQFAIALIHKDHPDKIIAATRECPLSIGYDDARKGCFLSSDPNAFIGKSLNVFFLESNEIVEIGPRQPEIYDLFLKKIDKKSEKLHEEANSISKEGFPHFMLKEIFEQPASIQRAIEAPFSLPEEYRNYRSVLFIGSGTSAHAGSIGALFLEQMASIPSRSEIASEVRYRLVAPDTLIIALSQSGETADTLSAVREMKSRGFSVLSICNVKNSTLARETTHCLFLQAGPEISVCSTKAFTSQLTMLYRFALFMGKLDQLAPLQKIPSQVEEILQEKESISLLSKKYSHYKNFFFLGRRHMVATCQEAALKLKEISYLNANGYPAGELKHGPIALLDLECVVVAFCANAQTEEKIASNLQEVKARGAPLLAFAPKSFSIVAKIADDVIWLPSSSDALAPFTSIVAGQLFAYYLANHLGRDIDQPRNLAKSVTVE